MFNLDPDSRFTGSGPVRTYPMLRGRIAHNAPPDPPATGTPAKPKRPRGAAVLNAEHYGLCTDGKPHQWLSKGAKRMRCPNCRKTAKRAVVA